MVFSILVLVHTSFFIMLAIVNIFGNFTFVIFLSIKVLLNVF